MNCNKILFLLILLTFSNKLFAQLISDTTYIPLIHNPAYDLAQGPILFIDEGHHNFHTKNGRYKPFSYLLERDGYDVRVYQGEFSKEDLAEGKILVVSNALNERNVRRWILPNPSAFTKMEVEVVRQWVFDGGNLFLIADHMPMAGASQELAKQFGFIFTNGFAIDTVSRNSSIFSLENKTLSRSIITEGRDSTERVQQVVTFVGQAFKIPDDAHPILTFDKSHINLLPDTAWVFNEETINYNVSGWSQGAFKKYGKGRVVVFGEAAMFTAHIYGPQNMKIGMNNSAASENYQLLLNLVHWLDGKIN